MPRPPKKTSRERAVPLGNRHRSGPTPCPAHRHPPIRVLCIDDHTVLVQGLGAQFAVDGRLVVAGHLCSSDRLLEEVDRLKPNLVLLDIEVPGPDIFEMGDRLKRTHPGVPFSFLSAYVRDGYISAAYRSGANGYICKADDPEDIMNCVLAIAESTDDVFVMSPKVRERCGCGGFQTPGSHHGVPAACRRSSDKGLRTPLESLTNREMEILRLIGKGLSRVEIATELSRSVKTIDGHQDRIMKKLGISSRAELMLFAVREGLAEA